MADVDGKATGDAESRAFYEIQKYPGPDAIITYVWANRLKPFLPDGPFRFLDAGCGSGRHTVGMLLRYPEATAVSIDLSAPSLAEAEALARVKNIDGRVEFMRRTFSDPMSFDQPFDLAVAAGTIHHSPDPTASLCNIADVVRPGGLVAGMIYGQRGQVRRYEVREMLGLLHGADPETSFREFYQPYRRKYGGYMDLTLREIVARWRKRAVRFKRRITGTAGDFGYYRGDVPMADIYFDDAMLTPIDVAVDSRELKSMFDAAGLELVELFTFGRPEPELLPNAWRPVWEKLSLWDRIRLCELIHPLPTSFSFLTRKKD